MILYQVQGEHTTRLKNKSPNNMILPGLLLSLLLQNNLKMETKISNLTEVFKDIHGYEGLYQVSNIGNVKSLAGKIWGGKIQNSKLLIPKLSNRGYLRLLLYPYSGSRKMRSIHRIVAQTFIPNPENKPTVNHRNGIKTDNLAENLEWATQKENIAHSFQIGLSKIKKGSKVGGSKLTEEIIPLIRKQYDTGNFSQKEVGDQFGICQMSVNQIVRRKSWRHVL